jgi:hypothetical protein
MLNAPEMHMNRESHFLARILLLGVLAAAAGCASPPASGARFISAKARQDPGFYAVTAVVENPTPRPLSLDEVGIEMTAFDERGEVIVEGYPFSLLGRVAPFATTRVPLNRPDRERRTATSKIRLLDSRGRIISEIEVGPIESGEEEDAGPNR